MSILIVLANTPLSGKAKHLSLLCVTKYYNILTINTMKNYFRLPIIALAMSVSFAACKGNSSGSSADSSKVDSSSTTRVDSTVKPDTTKKDSAAMASGDTTKKDTVNKTTVKKTVKKSSEKKTN
jgi:hypothetical protein